tara:strand:+ start:1920 stop:2987 length:1068 start_codon:yes stop_codon:yes gene_type:complete
MLKKIITDTAFKHKYRGSSLEKILKNGLLRKQYSSSSYGQYVNPATSKLVHLDGWAMKPDGSSLSSFVVINDSRPEIAQIGERGLITSSLIFEELLGCNRGQQNYDYERNRFWVQDETANATEIHSSTTIRLLDVLWYMAEDNVDAVEIELGDDRISASDLSFMSRRYRNIVEKDIARALTDAPSLLKPYYAQMVKRFKKEDYGDENSRKGINWGESSYSRVFSAEGKKNAQWTGDDSIANILCSYYEYRGGTDDKPPKSFSAYVDNFIKKTLEDNLFSSNDYIAMIARNFNYCSANDEDYLVGIALNKSVNTNWEEIAKSKFKRSRDWYVNEGNVIKSEVLKLRRQLEEGTFNE